ncbi:MAG: hypothetical protein CL758_08000 [Chloroflexi bacterium]|nr:hypothetical protein [Chloroflexota bacterium]|tara:strand:+ start:9312 stop:10124 length:813 start_codon:yes stop_codon:yes gene_type:complete
MKYKLIALDIDGTIRDIENPVSIRTIKIIKELVGLGVEIVVATGRTFNSAKHILNGMSGINYIVPFQGSQVVDLKTNLIEWHSPLSSRMLINALDQLENYSEFEVMVHCKDQVFVSSLTNEMKSYGTRNNIDITYINNLKKLSTKKPDRIVVLGDNFKIKELEFKLQCIFKNELYITRSLPYFCEILNPNSGKDKALSWLCHKLQINKSQTIAFGNGFNDLQMIEWVEMGVAVKNSVPEVINVANKIAPSIQNDGVASTLEEFLKSGYFG